MIEIMLFVFGIIFLSTIGIILLRERSKYGLAPFYIFIAVSVVYYEITPFIGQFTFLGFEVIGTHATIFPFIFLSLLWINDIRGIEEARNMIHMIILVVLLIIFFNFLFIFDKKDFLSSIFTGNFELIYSLFYPDTVILFLFGLGFVVSVFLLIVIYNFLNNINTNKFLSVFLSLTIALSVHGIIFMSGLYLTKENTAGLLFFHIVYETIASFLYSLSYIVGCPLIINKNHAKNIQSSKESVEIDELKTGFSEEIKDDFRVLVAEDSPEVMELMRHIIKYENWEIVEAKNGKEALGMVFAENPNILLLDIMMPEMDGYGVVKVLRSHRTTKDIPIIMITAKSEKEDKIKGMDLEIDDYITKPFLPEELVARIKMVMRRYTL